jgi:hypothetical protein
VCVSVWKWTAAFDEVRVRNVEVRFCERRAVLRAARLRDGGPVPAYKNKVTSRRQCKARADWGSGASGVSELFVGLRGKSIGSIYRSESSQSGKNKDKGRAATERQS